jgi:hypothetical protein
MPTFLLKLTKRRGSIRPLKCLHGYENCDSRLASHLIEQSYKHRFIANTLVWFGCQLFQEIPYVAMGTDLSFRLYHKRSIRLSRPNHGDNEITIILDKRATSCSQRRQIDLYPRGRRSDSEPASPKISLHVGGSELITFAYFADWCS